MTLTVTPLTPSFVAEISGIDIARPVNRETFAAIRDAFNAYSILIFRGQEMDDESQIAFSERFGRCEGTRGVNPAAGTVFARQSNLDMSSGETIAEDDRRMFYQKANMLWHADSTFKPVLSLCSILSARIIPPAGGATEFASTRAAYDSLDDAAKAEIEDLEVEHDFIFSRGRVGFTFSGDEAELFPMVRHRLVRVNRDTGRKSVLIGAHAKGIAGWPEEKARALLEDLEARATRPGNTWRHDWREGDVVVWDNQAALHRATPYDTVNHRRLMQRTTISEEGAWPAF